MTNRKHGTTRRRFLGTIGAAAAATALPVPAAGAEKAPPKRTNDRHAILDLPPETVNAVRAWYAAAVAEVALQLRPRFLSGELHGWTEEDSEMMDAAETRQTYNPPTWRVERECGKRFVRGSISRAYAVLLVSPSEIETFDGACQDPRYHAANAMGWDVIRYARAQGWTVMAAGEEAPGVTPKTRRYYSRGYFESWNTRECG